METHDLTEVPDLKQRILDLLVQIPKGMVTSYKDIALALGDGAAARAVGTVMASNQEPEKYPCWRVVYSNGEVGKYSAPGGREEKITRMKREGIEVENGRIKNFSEVRYNEFEIEAPLPRLRRIQNYLKGLAEEERLDSQESVAGVDVSYGKNGIAGAYVEMEVSGEEIRYRETISEERVKFPYIPGYLAFRELPILRRLLERVRGERPWADVIFVDGNGLLHPRGAGLATHLGVVLDHPTIGVAKNLLCGKTENGELSRGQAREVKLDGENIGLELKTTERANPIYVSIGNRVSLEEAGDLTRRISTYKLPEPLRQAHKIAKSEAT
ncbi:MAG: endonuclease V [Candidatus Bipolaricaulia bacterium]